MNSQQYQLMQVVQKISIFKGFDVKEVTLLLKICHSMVFEPGQVVYTIGEPGMEMLILLKGRLNVAGGSGEILASIEAGGAIGEMGLFTGHPRSANIIAMEESTGFVIKKKELIALLSNNKNMHIKLLYNLIFLLSNRLAEANRVNEEQLMERGKAEEEDEEEEDEEDEEDEEEDAGEEEEEED